ncbi:MAG: tyrosine-type recombinase/integrase [Akkermansia sp.]|nr:tyrosine-type recombinase/integrase [Akkermansia sp.]
MKKHKQKEADNAALEILRSTGADVLEAALVAKSAMEAARGKVKRALKCIIAGAEALRQQEKTVSFEKAVEAALEARKDRRTRTLYDFRYFTRRFMLRCKGLAKRRVRSITPQECSEYIEKAFDTPRQRQKARLILSGVFSTAMKRGWCDANPVARVEAPRVVEQPVPILTPQEIEQITTTAETYQGGSCAAAVGMMLYAGIRPHEVARLTWAQVDLQARAIYILPRHSKTGGARRVTIHRPLMRILSRHQQPDTETICPRNWLHHWRELRRAAGWDSPAHRWPQDALRHTFASYHLSHFRSFAELQVEIGHRDATLLRTRYVDQRAVVNAGAFWEYRGQLAA